MFLTDFVPVIDTPVSPEFILTLVPREAELRRWVFKYGYDSEV